MLSDIRRELRNDHSIGWWAKRVAIYGLIGPYTRYRTPTGIDIVAADWDTLIVLDACREDQFREVVGVDPFDQYGRRRSKGSATVEWTRKNFAGTDCGDTVYVSANPYVSKLAPEAFHEIRPVWNTHFDETAGTVLPGDVTDAAIEALGEFPHKRLVVHYMQPHHPFLDPEWGNENFHNPDEKDPWERLEDGTDNLEAVQSAYYDNLARAWPEVDRLLDHLSGRTVVTSDHGNLLGERLNPFPVRGYGHSIGLHVPELVTVPWGIREDGPRRDITKGTPHASPRNQEALEDRLQQLGYR